MIELEQELPDLSRYEAYGVIAIIITVFLFSLTNVFVPLEIDFSILGVLIIFFCGGFILEHSNILGPSHPRVRRYTLLLFPVSFFPYIIVSALFDGFLIANPFEIVPLLVVLLIMTIPWFLGALVKRYLIKRLGNLSELPAEDDSEPIEKRVYYCALMPFLFFFVGYLLLILIFGFESFSTFIPIILSYIPLSCCLIACLVSKEEDEADTYPEDTTPPVFDHDDADQ